jgi:predicted O-methyltransferase YrrM
MTDNPMSHLDQRLRLGWRIVRDRSLLQVPPGHPYSPIPSDSDRARAVARSEQGRRRIPGVELRDDQQWALLAELRDDYPQTARWLGSGRPRRYALDNTWFTGSDAVCLALMLRRLRPRRLVEVGSGYSSALALDVDETFLDGRIRFTFIDPEVERLRSLLVAGDVAGAEARGVVIESEVQDVPLAVFQELGDGDVLAIDSSHVARAGSDVTHLLFEVLPSLAPGVLIHVHDIFHPFEYPRRWLAAGTALNEAYALHALLQSNDRLALVLWNHYLIRFHRDWFAENLPLVLSAPFETGGIWLRVAGGDPALLP